MTKILKGHVRELHEEYHANASGIVKTQEGKDLLTKLIYAQDRPETGVHYSVYHATSNELLEELVRREKEYMTYLEEQLRVYGKAEAQELEIYGKTEAQELEEENARMKEQLRAANHR